MSLNHSLRVVAAAATLAAVAPVAHGRHAENIVEVGNRRGCLELTLKTPEAGSTEAQDGPYVPELSPEKSALTRFKAQYERLTPKDKAAISWEGWEGVEARLMANSGRYLKLAAAMEQGGILFGVDKEGNPLFADGGVEPVLCGMNYTGTRNAVMFKEESGRKTPTGYEMFPYPGDDKKSDEILAFEAFTGDDFVRPEDRKNYRGAFLESGENPESPGGVLWQPEGAELDEVAYKPSVSAVKPQVESPRIGTRRLLRVKLKS